MNWKMKAHALAVLSRLPGGRRLYLALQSGLRTNRLDAGEGVRRSLEVCRLIAEQGRPLAGATVVEVGTGWRPFLPLLLHLAGAKWVVTLDINPWLSEASAFETYRALGGHLTQVADGLGLDPGVVAGRYEALRAATTLDGLLAAARVEYRYPGDARRTGLGDRSVDCVCSSNVLEHVGPDVLRDIHREAVRVLRPGGLAIHRVNPGDHFANVDRGITTANFLRYSERQWRWYGGTGLSYHNRLRGVEHGDLLCAAGLEVVVDRARVDPRALAAISAGELPIDPGFRRFTPDELAADYVWLVGRAAVPAPPDTTPGGHARTPEGVGAGVA